MPACTSDSNGIIDSNDSNIVTRAVRHLSCLIAAMVPSTPTTTNTVPPTMLATNTPVFTCADNCTGSDWTGVHSSHTQQHNNRLPHSNKGAHSNKIRREGLEWVEGMVGLNNYLSRKCFFLNKCSSQFTSRWSEKYKKCENLWILHNITIRIQQIDQDAGIWYDKYLLLSVWYWVSMRVNTWLIQTCLSVVICYYFICH